MLLSAHYKTDCSMYTCQKCGAMQGAHTCRVCSRRQFQVSGWRIRSATLQQQRCSKRELVSRGVCFLHTSQRGHHYVSPTLQAPLSSLLTEAPSSLAYKVLSCVLQTGRSERKFISWGKRLLHRGRGPWAVEKMNSGWHACFHLTDALSMQAGGATQAALWPV